MATAEADKLEVIPYTCMYLYTYIFIVVSVSMYISIYIYIRICVCFSIHTCAWMYVYFLLTYTLNRPQRDCVRPSIHLSIHPTCLSIHLSVYQPIYPYFDLIYRSLPLSFNQSIQRLDVYHQQTRRMKLKVPSCY